MSAVRTIFMASWYGAHVCVSSRHISHPHSSVPRHEADALRNDRRAVLSALQIHTATIRLSNTREHHINLQLYMNCIIKLRKRYSFVHYINLGLPCFLRSGHTERGLPQRTAVSVRCGMLHSKQTLLTIIF